MNDEGAGGDRDGLGAEERDVDAREEDLEQVDDEQRREEGEAQEPAVAGDLAEDAASHGASAEEPGHGCAPSRRTRSSTILSSVSAVRSTRATDGSSPRRFRTASASGVLAIVPSVRPPA